MAKRKQKTPDHKLRQAFRTRLNMPEPEATLQDAWVDLEEAVVAISDASKQLDPDEAQKALAEGLEAAISAVEAVEDVLVREGLVEEDDLLEPSTDGS